MYREFTRTGKCERHGKPLIQKRVDVFGAVLAPKVAKWDVPITSKNYVPVALKSTQANWNYVPA